MARNMPVSCDEQQTLHNFRGRTIAPNRRPPRMNMALARGRGENEGLGARGSMSQMHVSLIPASLLFTVPVSSAPVPPFLLTFGASVHLLELIYMYVNYRYISVFFFPAE